MWIAEATVSVVAESAMIGKERQDVSDWTCLLGRMGIWDHPAEIAHRMLGIRMDPWWVWPWSMWPARDPVGNGLLFRVPLPDPQHRGVSLGHWLVYALGNRASLTRMSASEFAYVFFAAAAIVAAAGRPGYGWPRRDLGLRELRRRTAEWLYHQRPIVDETTTAGRALDKFAERSIHAT